MKKLAISLVVCLSMLAVSCSRTFHPSGPMSSRTVSATNFNKISNLGVYDVYYQQGDTFKVELKGPREIIKRIDVRVKGNTLYIDQHGVNLFFNDDDANKTGIYVMSPDILGISQIGTGSIICKSIDTDCLDLNLQGTGDIDLDYVICDELYADLAGTGDIDVDKLTSPKTRVRLAGTGDISIHFVHSGAVKAELAGTGDITLSGDVQQFVNRQAGTGDINTDGLRVGKME